MSDADFILVGSGPAGVSAALALAEAGRSVLMLDGGSDDEGQPPANELGPEDGLSPKLRTPQARRLLQRFAQANHVTGENFVAAGSLGRGGLSRIWGGFAAEFRADDLEGWPLSLAALTPSYARITARIGISGESDDVTGAASAPLQPPPPLGAACSVLLRRHQARPGGLVLGHARNALLSRPLAARPACDLRGACLWGCPIGAIYDARQDVARLRRFGNFRLADDACVVALTRITEGWRVTLQDGRSFQAPRILLAAGTLASTRLAAPLLPRIPDWRLLSNPTLATPLFVRGALAAPRTPTHTLAQLAYRLEGEPVFGAVYETAQLPVSAFTGARRLAGAVFRRLSPALLVAVTSFPGRFSRNRLSFDGSGLTLHGGFDPALDAAEQAAARRLARSWRTLGALALPGARRARPGTDAHFAGTLPMGGTGASGTTILGELAGQAGLHVVDDRFYRPCPPSMPPSPSWPMPTASPPSWPAVDPPARDPLTTL